MASAISRLAILATAPIVACASLAFAPMAHADNVRQSGQSVTHDGLSAATAAASCWDIKQRNPAASDGTYWLQTPAMDAPAQFFCDQTTDGGGWVLIAAAAKAGKAGAAARATPRS